MRPKAVVLTVLSLSLIPFLTKSAIDAYFRFARDVMVATRTSGLSEEWKILARDSL